MTNPAFEKQKGKGIKSSEQARAMGKKGGPRSGVAKRKKKLTKEYLSLLLTSEAPEDLAEIATSVFDIPPEDVIILDALVARLVHEGIGKGNIQAIKESLDRVLGKADQKIEHSGSIGSQELTEEDKNILEQYYQRRKRFDKD